MAKSDWRKLEAIFEQLAQTEGYGSKRNANGDLITCTQSEINLTELAQELANHVTIPTPTPLQVKS